MGEFLFWFVLGVSLFIIGIIYEDKLVEFEDYIFEKIKDYGQKKAKSNNH